MNRRLMTIIVTALAVATAASYLVYQIVKTRMIANGTPVANRIVVAAKDLQTGTLVREADLTFANWVGTVPKGFSLSPKDLIGRGVVSPIYEGEPVVLSRLAAAGAGGGLAATIPNGMRACAVKVNDVVGVAGFVVPGMRVDVLVSGNNAATQANGPRVRTILQNVTVLSAGQNYQKDAEGKPVEVQVVNLLVTPEQAEMLSLASNETRIQLVLRNPMDNEVAKTSGSAMSDLFSEDRPKAPVKVASYKPVGVPSPVVAPQPAPPPVLQTQRVEVLNGPKRTEATFSKSEENR
jgi:pilus assembly protein CpaB